ncbi:hypothetical protein D3C79_939250 [compost metagenome]
MELVAVQTHDLLGADTHAGVQVLHRVGLDIVTEITTTSGSQMAESHDVSNQAVFNGRWRQHCSNLYRTDDSHWEITSACICGCMKM